MAPRPSLPTSSKKRKSTGEKSSDSLTAIQQLESQLTAAVSSKASLNPLADLLDIAQEAADVFTLTKAIYALYRVFVVIITNGLLLSTPGSEETKAVRAWIHDRLHDFTQLLVGLMKDEDSTLRTSSLKILMSLEKHLSSSLSKMSSSSSTPHPQFHVSHFKQIVHGLLLCPPLPRNKNAAKRHKGEGSDSEHDGKVATDVRDLFVDEWLSECDDVRWFFLRESANLISTYSKKDHPNLPDNLLSFLERITTFPTESSELNKWWVEELGAKPPKVRASEDDEDEDDPAESQEKTGEEEDDWRKFFEEETVVQPVSKDPKKPNVRLHKLSVHQSLHSLASHKTMFTRAWLSLLPLLSIGSSDASKALATRALNVMHRGVMPHLTRPVLVMDWIASCVDYGGTVGLLALNGLFILMKEYNLDYPAFYTRLYAFLDRDVLHVKHRARFFRLTELFLSSTLLPATLLASFVKRLARLSLNAPPAAIVMIIPFTYNILKKHPALMVMIHRPDDMKQDQIDPFNNSEPNPTLTGAIDSSLWELYSHRQHYHSAVSTLTRIFEEAFTKPNYSLEDFLDHTYSTLFETEAKRRIKKEPAIAMEPVHKKWFVNGSNDEEDISLDRVDQLWSFS
ncbi:CBF-domain-containing protein [Panus rudis PR-1116 ss-1]|nr:CBF-domain-containing protein [Panus rudis PR-1116 ss-1]